MKKQETVSVPIPGAPASEPSEAEAFDLAGLPNDFAETSGGFAFGDTFDVGEDPLLDSSKLLSQGHQIGWALVKNQRDIILQLSALNSLIFGICKQVLDVKLELISPLKLEKPRRKKAKAPEEPKAKKPKTPKATKPKTPKAKKGNEDEDNGQKE